MDETDLSNNDVGIALVDVNGDGFADIIKSRQGSYRDLYLWNNLVYASASTSMSNIPYMIDSSKKDRGIRFGDFNGDGYADYMESKSGSTSAVYMNKADGTGWRDGVTTNNTNYFVDSSGNDAGVRVADLNGDGLDDMVRRMQDDSTATTSINKGDGTSWANTTNSVIPGISGASGADIGTRIADINADGLPDIIISTVSRGIHVYINQGDGTSFVEKSVNTLPYLFDSTDTKDIGTRFIDGNDDGIPDFVTSSPNSAHINYFSSSGGPVDVLTTITLPTGGTIAVEYSGLRAASTLLRVVKTVTSTPGFGATSVGKDYNYSSPSFFTQYQNRKFAGFGQVDITDSQNYRTTTYYHQGNGNLSSAEYDDQEGKINLPYLTEKWHVGDTYPYERTINRWEKKAIANGRTLIYPKTALTRSFDALSSSKDSASSLDYATSTGNLIEKIDWGEVTGATDGTFTDTGSDKRTTTYAYVSSVATSTYPATFGLPSQQVLTDNSGTKVSETKNYYDSQAFGLASQGNPTKQEFWKSGTNYASTTKAYNSYGLVTQSQDGNDNATTYTYDTYNLYPATTTNAIAQSQGFLYNYAFGKVKQTNDVNNSIFQTIFDGFGRPTEEKQPSTTTPSTLVTKVQYSYVDTALNKSVHVTTSLDSSLTTDSFQYVDGLGRVIQTRARADGVNTYAVKDTLYDNRGALQKESLPYFASSTPLASSTLLDALLTSYTRDPLDRVTLVANAVGSTTTSYVNWKTTITDPNGKVKNAYKDAFGNLTKVEEINGGSTYTTTYTYNPLGNLTNITDAAGNVRNFTYDGVGRRLTAEDLHASGDTSYGTWYLAYDNAGNIASSTDPKSQNTVYTYDGLNRVLTENYTGAAGTEVTYSYDSCGNGRGRVCGATTTASGINYTYDPLGRIKTERNTISGSTFSTAYNYDRQGNPADITYPDNALVTYTYNSAGLIETVAKRENGTTTAIALVQGTDYGPTGAVTYRNFGNGTETKRTYDASKLYRLANIRTTSATSSGETFGMGGIGLLAADEEAFFASQNAASSFASTTPAAEQPATVPSPRIEHLLTTHSADERATIKGQEIAKLNSIPRISRPDYDIEIILMQPIEGGLQLFARAWDKQGQQIGFGKDGSVDLERFRIFNPPILVDDPQGTIIRRWITDQGEHKERRLREDPKEALLQSLEHTIKVKKEKFTNKNIIEGKIGNTTDTFYPSAGASTPTDGRVNGTDYGDPPAAAWNTVRTEAGSGGTVTSVQEGVTILSSVTTSKWRQFQRLIFGYNTSPLGTDAITSATLSFVSSSKTDDYVQSVMVDRKVPVSTNDLVSADYTLSNWDQADQATSQIALSAWTANDTTYNDFTLNTAGLGNVNKTGYSWFGLRMSGDFSNTEPTWIAGQKRSEANIEMADAAGTSHDPKLVVEHSAGNQAPYAPISLLVEGLTNPTLVFDSTPEFSAIYSDPNAGDQTKKYRIQVSTSSAFTSSLWDITSSMATTTESSRIPDISYSGTTTLASSTTYYWRIKFWDAANAEGAWSTVTSTFILPNIQYAQTFAYNSIGNIATSSVLGNYLYAGTGYANPHAPTSINGVTLTYDNNGNVLTYGARAYTWDYRNRITQAGTGTATSTYGYDYGGSRVSEALAGVTTKYASRLYSTNSASTTKYIYAGDTLIATVERAGNATTTFIVHPDHLGGTAMVTNASGTVVQTIEYYPYGAVRGNTKTSSMDERKKYIGQYYDTATALSYLNARYYDGGRGQFLSEDPAASDNPEQFLQDPQQLNSYSYARNNPINAIDPDGKNAEFISEAQGIPYIAAFIGLAIAFYALYNAATDPAVRQAAYNGAQMAIDSAQWVSNSIGGGSSGSANTNAQSSISHLASNSGITSSGSGMAVSTPVTARSITIPQSQGGSFGYPNVDYQDRGLAPDGVVPPVANPGDLKVRPTSKTGKNWQGEKTYWEPDGTEWRYHPEDKWHNPHWDKNPHTAPNSPTQKVPINDNPILK